MPFLLETLAKPCTGRLLLYDLAICPGGLGLPVRLVTTVMSRVREDDRSAVVALSLFHNAGLRYWYRYRLMHGGWFARWKLRAYTACIHWWADVHVHGSCLISTPSHYLSRPAILALSGQEIR